MTIVRIINELPIGIETLAASAEAEGVRNLSLLISGWVAGQRFDAEGEALFAAFADRALVGVGGVTPCSNLTGAERVRRFYVAPDHRRSGVGRALAVAAMHEGLQHARILTCNARATAAATPFWESMGFRPVSTPGITHLFEA
ncbi:MAG TPA: GNAT family N-acetyltransferase [Caulobacteraceae bacterium]|nr:GNAT family N-acetyltransferase [Caulobacteraceae bacterium]